MDRREPSLIKINSAKQKDFVRYLFARTRVKEQEKEIRTLQKTLNIKNTTIKSLKEELGYVKEAIIGQSFPEVAKLETYKKQLRNTMAKSVEKRKKIERLQEEIHILRIENVKLKNK